MGVLGACARGGVRGQEGERGRKEAALRACHWSRGVGSWTLARWGWDRAQSRSRVWGPGNPRPETAGPGKSLVRPSTLNALVSAPGQV